MTLIWTWEKLWMWIWRGWMLHWFSTQGLSLRLRSLGDEKTATCMSDSLGRSDIQKAQCQSWLKLNGPVVAAVTNLFCLIYLNHFSTLSSAALLSFHLHRMWCKTCFETPRHLRLVRSIPPWRRRCFINHTPHTNTTMAESCGSSCLHLPLRLQFLLHFCNCYLILLVPRASTSSASSWTFLHLWLISSCSAPTASHQSYPCFAQQQQRKAYLRVASKKKSLSITYIWVPDTIPS